MGNTPIIPIEFQVSGKSFEAMIAQMEKLFKLAEKFNTEFKGGGKGGGKKANDGLKATVSTMEKLQKKMEAYKKEADKSGNSIHKMESRMKQFKIQAQIATDPVKAKKYAGEVARIRKEIVKAKNATRGWGKAMGSFQFKFNALGNIAANVASTITNKITRGLREAVETVVEFEKTFAEVLTLLGKVQKDRFKNVLKQNSVDIMKKYGLTVEDTNKAMFDAISAGVKVADVYNVLDAAARLAVGGVTDLNSATKGIASVMNAFSLEMSEAENVASAFFQAQKFGITYIDEMVASMGRANTIASLAGASYREMLAAFTAITKSGLNTEEAITGLRNVFKELVASSGEAAAELNRLGIATGSNAVQARGFIGVLDDLNAAYLKNNEVIPKIFGNIRGLTGIMGIVGERYETFRFVLEEVNNVMSSQEALNDAVNEQMGTTAKKVDVLTASWNAFIIALTEGQSQQGSAIKTLLDGLTKLIQVLTPEFYEEYANAVAMAQIQVEAFGRAARAEARVRLVLIDDDEAANKAYTNKLIFEYRKRIKGQRGALEEAQDIFLNFSKQLEEAKLEAEAFADANDGLWSVEKVQNVKDLEKAVDLYKISLLKIRTVYEGLLNDLGEILKKEEDKSEKQKTLSDQERKNLLNLLKLRRDIEILKIKITEDGFTEQSKVEKKRHEFDLLIIKASLKIQVEKDLLIERENLKHKNKMLEINRKFDKENFDLTHTAIIARIKGTKAGYEKEIALANENNEYQLDIIKNGNHDKKTQDKLELNQALQHQLDLNVIHLRYVKKRFATEKRIALELLDLKQGSRRNDLKKLETSLKYDERLNQLLYDKKIILFDEFLNRLDSLWLKFEKDVKDVKITSLGDLFNIDYNIQDALNASIDSILNFTDIWVDAADRRIDAIQREIDASEERLNRLQADRDHEWQRMQEGYANNYTLKQKELEDEKLRMVELRREERRTLEAKRKAADAQVAIDTILQVSNIIVAGSQIVKDATSKAGVFGLAIAIPLLAALVGSFLAFKANAQEAAGFAKGDIDIQGRGTGKSDSISARLSKGESVMTAKTTKTNKRTLSFMQDNPDHPLFSAMEKYGVNTLFNQLTDQMQNNWVLLNNGNNDKWNEKMYLELKSGNDELKNRPYSYMKAGKLYTIEGNRVTITPLHNG